MTSSLRIQFGDFELHEADARLKRNGVPIALPPKAFGVLCALLRNPGTLVTKNALLDAVWGHQHVSESVLKTVISQVRSALDDDASRPRFIQTASRLGYRFIGASAAEITSPIVASPPRKGFVGRETELAKLQEHWQRVKKGQQILVWIAGEAGIGKTTLVDTFVPRSGAAVIAQGFCVEQYGAGEPYMPVLQGLADLCRAYPDLVPLMRSCAPTWLLQLPWLLGETDRAALTRELAGTSSERMLREFQELMIRFTAQRPLLFVLEDLHWADMATVTLMDHFARQRSKVGQVMWIATFRLTQVIAEEHPLRRIRQELRLHRLCDEIALDCFSEAEVQQYLRKQDMSAGDSEDFVRLVHAHTEGLPLFVANVVEALRAPASGPPTPNALPVPNDLMDAVERRISLLPPEMVAVLESAAVCGAKFRARVVASMLGRAYEQVIAACDQLVKQQYWLRHVATLDLADGSLDAEYAFRHTIYRHVFYLRIADMRRLTFHRGCAQALKAGAEFGISPSQAELAFHHEHGREMREAISAYTSAASQALRAFTPHGAYEHCDNAQRLLPHIRDENQRLSLELSAECARGAAAAQIHGVPSEEARVIFERVRELCEQAPRHPAWAIMASGYGGSLFTRAEYAKLENLADRLDRLQRDDLPTLRFFSSIFRAFAASARGECRVASDLWMRTIAICEAITDRRAYEGFTLDSEVGARANSVRTFFERGLFDRARTESSRAVRLATELGQPLSRTLAHWRAAMLEVRLENPEAVLAHAEALRKIVETTSVTQGEGLARYLKGWAIARLGEPKAGLALIREGLQHTQRMGNVASCTEVMGYAAEAMILASDWTGAEEQLSVAFVRAGELGEWAYSSMLKLLEARAAWGRGDSALAFQRSREALETARRQGALGFELKAALRLLEHPDSGPEDRAALAALLADLPEGRDTPDVIRAEALLA